MTHDLETTPDGDLFCHFCRKCGAKKTTRTERWYGACKLPPCIHLGKETGETVKCLGCQGDVRVKVFACAVYGICLPETGKDKSTSPAVHKCDGCESRK